jgi:GNAT superfamily N-acetyltransferase
VSSGTENSQASDDPHQFRIEPATERNVPLLLSFIRHLADYEALLPSVTATEDDIRAAFFGPSPAAEAVVGYAGQEPAGFAVYFQSFSTFVGRPGLYLEDLFVLPAWRGRGFGRRLLAHLARVAVDRGYGRMEWSVLDWNVPAIAVYRRIGSTPLDEWTVHRLTGDALRTLASEDRT